MKNLTIVDFLPTWWIPVITIMPTKMFSTFLHKFNIWRITSIFRMSFYTINMMSVRCQTKVHNCKYSYLLWYFIVLLSKILLLIDFCFIARSAKSFKNWFAGGPQAQNYLGNDFRHARKCQTIREMTFAMRGNNKPFGKWHSPTAEMPNHSGNNFRQARKCQTTRETTFANRGNAKPFGK